MLRASLQDTEAYVRKTAALCVPKVYEISPGLIEQAGIIDLLLKNLHEEGNALVLANILLAL
jgi:AP-1 complex subunit beta-1